MADQRSSDDLTQALRRTRELVVELMPERACDLLEGYEDRETPLERSRWLADVIEGLIELAEPLPAPDLEGRERAYCPLCGQGSTRPDEEGYTLPEGLRRHLEGRRGHPPCKVMGVAKDLAYGHWGVTKRDLRRAAARAIQGE